MSIFTTKLEPILAKIFELGERLRAPQKAGLRLKQSFVFLLEEKVRRAQIRNSEQNFSLGWRALASGGGAERQ